MSDASGTSRKKLDDALVYAHKLKATNTPRINLFLLPAGDGDAYDTVLDHVINTTNAYLEGELTPDEFKRVLFDEQV